MKLLSFILVGKILLSFVQPSFAVGEAYAVNWVFKAFEDEYDKLEIHQGDSVTFHWETKHDLMKFKRQSDYQQCDFTNASYEAVPSSKGEKTIVFNTPGSYFYGCSLYKHCEMGGMKIQIKVQQKTDIGKPEKPKKKLFLNFRRRCKYTSDMVLQTVKNISLRSCRNQAQAKRRVKGFQYSSRGKGVCILLKQKVSPRAARTSKTICGTMDKYSYGY